MDTLCPTCGQAIGQHVDPAPISATFRYDDGSTKRHIDRLHCLRVANSIVAAWESTDYGLALEAIEECRNLAEQFHVKGLVPNKCYDVVRCAQAYKRECGED